MTRSAPLRLSVGARRTEQRSQPVLKHRPGPRPHHLTGGNTIMSNTMPDTAVAALLNPANHVPPITCPSWCADGTGHADEFSRDDQWHRGQTHEIELGMEAPYKSSGKLLPSYAWVELQESPGEATTVNIGKVDETVFEMTPDEAHKLALNLLFAVAQISGQA